MSVRRVTSVVLIVLFAAGSALAGQQAVQESAAWQKFALGLQPGSSVQVRLKDGSRVRGTVVTTSDDSFVIKPTTRIPVAAVSLSFSNIESIEPWKEGMPPGVKVLLGVGIGVGAVFLAALIAFANWAS
jgi:hypothetical protein